MVGLDNSSTASCRVTPKGVQVDREFIARDPNYNGPSLFWTAGFSLAQDDDGQVFLSPAQASHIVAALPSVPRHLS
jgi:hypothetical protein